MKLILILIALALGGCGTLRQQAHTATAGGRCNYLRRSLCN